VRIVTFSSEDTGGCSVASVGNVFVGRPANAPKGGQSVFKKKSFTMPTDASLIENLRSDRLRTNGILGAFRDVRAKSAWGRYCRKSLFRVKPEKSSGRTGLVAFFGRRGNWNLTLAIFRMIVPQAEKSGTSRFRLFRQYRSNSGACCAAGPGRSSGGKPPFGLGGRPSIGFPPYKCPWPNSHNVPIAVINRVQPNSSRYQNFAKNSGIETSVSGSLPGLMPPIYRWRGKHGNILIYCVILFAWNGVIGGVEPCH
jgi:hypothetical protein